MFGYHSFASDFPVEKTEKFDNPSEDNMKVTKVMIWDVSGCYPIGPALVGDQRRERRVFPTGNPEKSRLNLRMYCLVMCLILAFSIGLCFGFLTLQSSLLQTESSVGNSALPQALVSSNQLQNSKELEGIFVNHSFSIIGEDLKENSSVTFIRNTTLEESEQQKLHRQSEGINSGKSATSLVTDDIYWSDYVENLLPQGFTRHQADEWTRYVRKGAVAVKLERGCGRMQNRLVTFADGRKACVRYRQNTDQIQGELFSFYLSQILNLRNLVPSTVGVVDLKLPLWERLSNEIASAQWHSQRPVVLTQYIPNLDVGSIPKLVRPAESHHLNKLELPDVVPSDQRDDLQTLETLQSVLKQQNSQILPDEPPTDFITNNLQDNHLPEEDSQKQSLMTWEIVELAQWSDLIIFDYLTANLDRVVNNLYNHQWNSNIMEAPAHNLAKNMDNNLLVFLDNESGLLHGYRLLEKYEAYHGLLLDNLCIFRRSTAQAIANLRREGNVGQLLNAMFERKNPDRVKDILPTIPEKSVKILNGRIRRVHEQILKCQGLFKSD